jgi:hypothetical protein
MSEEPPEPESEKPRFLLPDGCKDLIDALRQNEPSIPGLDPLAQRVFAILQRILEFQAAHGGAAAPLEALAAEGALSKDDLAFLQSHSIKYTPGKLKGCHGGGSFEIPTPDGFIFIGSGCATLPKHRTPLAELAGVIEQVLGLPRPSQDLILQIELSEDDGVGIAPGMITFLLQQPELRARASAIKTVAAEHGLSPFQDSPDLQGRYVLTFRLFEAAPRMVARVSIAILRRALGLADDDEMTYASAALED